MSELDPWLLAIDFGTSSTVAAIVAADRTELLHVGGVVHVPSAVMLDPDRGLVAGIDADEAATRFPDRVDRNPKRSLGRTTHLVLAATPVLTTDAVGAILATVAREAIARRGGVAPAGVVLTHPVRCGERRLGALVQAVRSAGLPEPRLLAEPVAAALAQADDAIATGAYVAVYDLGGGTFDAAVLQRTATGFAIAGQPGGSVDLGGELFDETLLAHVGRCVDELVPGTWDQLLADRSADGQRRYATLRRDVRLAKERLSETTQTSVAIGVIDREVRMTRSELEGMIEPLLRQSIEELQATIRRAGLQPTDLAAVYLVGGSSRIPLVARLVAEPLGIVPTVSGDPKAVVALGAARAATLLLAGSGAVPSNPIPTPTPTPTPAPATPTPTPTPAPATPTPAPAATRAPAPAPAPESAAGPAPTTDPTPRVGRGLAPPPRTAAAEPARPARRIAVGSIASGPIATRIGVGALLLATALGGWFWLRPDGELDEVVPPRPKFNCAATVTPRSRTPAQPDLVEQRALNTPIIGRPYLDGGVAAVVTADGSVHLLDATDLTTVAIGKIDGEPRADPVGDGRRLYVVSTGGRISAVALEGDDRGDVVWSRELGQPLGSPIVSAGVVYVGGRDDGLYAIRSTDGAELWHARIDSGIGATPALDGGVVYAGSLDGTVYAFSIGADGEVVDRYEAGAPIEAGVVVRDRLLAAATTEGDIRVWRVGNTTPIVQAATLRNRPVYAAPALGGDAVFVGADDCGLRAIATTGSDTGAQEWTYGFRGAVDRPVVAAGSVFVVSNDGYYSQFSAQGTLLAQRDFGAPLTGATVAGDHLVIATEDGRVYLVRK